MYATSAKPFQQYNYIMATFLGNNWKKAWKRASGVRFKVVAIFVVILCSFVFSGKVNASTIVYTSPQGTTLDVDGVITPAGTDSAMHYAFSGRGTSGSVIPMSYYGGLWNTLPVSFYGMASSTYETGTFCFSSGSPCSGTTTWEINPVANKILSINGVSTGASSTITHITLITPADNNATTSLATTSFMVGYYINTASTSPAYIPTSLVYTIKYQTPASWSYGTYTGAHTSTVTRTVSGVNLDLDNTGLDIQNILLPAGAYTWSASLVSTSSGMTASTCFGGVFCSWYGQDPQFTVGTTTLFQSETRTFYIGNSGYYTGTSTASSTPTGDAVTFCEGYSGTDVIVKTLCIIPNVITGALRWMFIPDTVAVMGNLATIQGDITNMKNIFPLGYVQRLSDIFSATTTSTSSLPVVTAVFQIGGNADMSTTSLTFDFGDMIAGGGTLLQSIHDPINNKTPRDVFEPLVQLSLALTIMLTILSDIMGTHKHQQDTASNKKYV